MSIMLHYSSNSHTGLLVCGNSFSIHEAAEIMPHQAGIKGTGTNINIPAVLVCYKPRKVRCVADVEQFCGMVLLVQLG